jgi:hypothetical protein
MSLEQELLSLVAADAGVSAFSPETRTEWRDQNATGNYIIATRISGSRESALQQSNQFRRARVQFDCFADDYSTVKDLAEAVTDFLHGFKGTAGPYTVETSVNENELDLGEQDGDESTRRVALDFSFIYLR